jgi:hypothetical protein
MFALNNRIVEPTLVQYIRETTNKSIARYIKKHKKDIQKNVVVHTSAANDDNDCPNSRHFFVLLPFVSLFSFLAGYYSKRISA